MHCLCVERKKGIGHKKICKKNEEKDRHFAETQIYLSGLFRAAFMEHFRDAGNLPGTKFNLGQKQVYKYAVYFRGCLAK
jgi:hypothetical protein